MTPLKNTPADNDITYSSRHLKIISGCTGSSEYQKVSFPVKYGVYSSIETRDHIFEFNLNNEIRHARSKKEDWRHPSEWLKRTMGNDWVYYSTGGYAGVFEALGEYYLPNLAYPTNSLIGGTPFKEAEIDDIATRWHDMICKIDTRTLPSATAAWVETIKKVTPKKLEIKAKKLFNIIGSRVSVMPPDARHVDYNIIPVSISDGCLYKCRFCKIKNKKKFSLHTKEQILQQIYELKNLYGRDLANYNAVFLGEHDALNSPDRLIFDSAKTAYDVLGLGKSFMRDAYLFLFGSADAFLNKKTAFFEELNALPFFSYINIGLESPDPATLDMIGKPITAEKVTRSFNTARKVNRSFDKIEVSCNFVTDETLPASHFTGLENLLRNKVGKPVPKGAVYLSPLKFGTPSRPALYDFYRLKAKSLFPTFLYLIQRL